jgi:hypothetical protein
VLTIFSTPRPFTGQFINIQNNAIQSWRRLVPAPEIILFGDEPGTRDAARRFGARHVADVASNDHGSLLISDIFAQAQRLANTPLVAFVNGDIILTQPLIRAIDIAATAAPAFLLVGQRTDLLVEPIDFGVPDWEPRLLHNVYAEGRLDGPLAIDYFVFPRGLLNDVPPFPVARTSYDNYLIWQAARLGARVVDATAFVTVVHQRHDYPSAGGYVALWEGPEARRSRQMVGHWSRYHTVADARWMITAEGVLVPARGLKYRLARPRRALGALLSFTRPLRRRLRREPHGPGG